MVWLQSVIPFVGILNLFQSISAYLTPRYHLIDRSLTWHEARSFCTLKYTDLATVNNMYNMNGLVNMVANRVAYAWIGLHRGGPDRWMWSDGSGGAFFTRWREGEPSNGDEWCGEMSEKGEWNDKSCGDEKVFVCYQRQANGANSYTYYSEKRNWDNSQEHCRSRHTDLATVKNEAENGEIADIIQGWIGSFLLPNYAWIGLFRDSWTWADGKQTSFRYWLRGSHHRGDCASVAVSQQGRWVEANCNEKKAFVCQGDLKVKKMVIRMKVRSDADLTNSTVVEALLEKLETDLKHQSVTDFTVRWRRHKDGVVFQPHEGH